MRPSVLRQPALWSAALPAACAVHCILAPVATLAVPALALAPQVEDGLMLASAVLALAVTGSGVRAHGRRGVWLPVLPVLAGLAAWVVSRLLHASPAAEISTTVLGSLLLTGGMIRSARLRHEAACRRCACPAHGD